MSRQSLRQPLCRANAALAAGRVLAWALLIGGWLALGSLGRQHLPLIAGGFLPMAMWLLVTGITLVWARQRRWLASDVRALLLAGGLVSAAGLAWTPHSPALGLTGLACGWAMVLVGASLTVRSLRRHAHHAAPPATTALIGAGLAWLAWVTTASAMSSGHGVLWLGALVVLLLCGPLHTDGPAIQACRSGLFDCALAQGTTRDWRHPNRWPAAIAALAMLPMMATLAVLDDACSVSGLPAGSSAGLHLLAMLGPAWMLRRRRIPQQVAATVLAALLSLGGIAMLLWPGQTGWMLAALAQGMAWSVAWAGRWHAHAKQEPVVDPQRQAPGSPIAAQTTNRAWHVLAPFVATASFSLALGALWSSIGPGALNWIHGTLAVAGSFAGVVALWPFLGQRGVASGSTTSAGMSWPTAPR